MFAITSNVTYNWVWIVVGILAVAGALRETKGYADKRAVRSDKLDALLKKTTANGGDTNDVGDVAKRTEELLKAHIVESRLDSEAMHEHFGQDAARFEDIHRRLGALELK